MIEITVAGKRPGILLIDDDFSHLTSYKWRINVRGYAHTNLPRNGAKTQKQLTLHHAVAGKPQAGMMIDHINHNRLDNRLSNLRHCTQSQNQMNSVISSRNTTGFKGVSPAGNKFRACININGKSVKLGCFVTAELAHRAYSKRAIQEYKEFAYIGQT